MSVSICSRWSLELNKDYGLHSKIIVNLQDEIYWTGLAFVQCFRLQVTLYSCPHPIWNHQLTQVALRDANSRLKGSSWVSNSKPPFCVVTVLPTVLWHLCSGSWHIKCLHKRKLEEEASFSVNMGMNIIQRPLSLSVSAPQMMIR